MSRRSTATVADQPKSVQAPQQISCSANTFVVCVHLAQGRVTEAWSTGKMMRNMNVLLQGSIDAQGRPQFVEQAHCLCNDGHALAAIRALEDLAGVTPPRGALLVRSMVQGLRCMQEHLQHVYHFHLADWASPDAALRADPAKAALLAEHADQDTAYFSVAQDQLRDLAQEQIPGMMGCGSCAHTAYAGADELHLMLQAHGLESLHVMAAVNEALELLGCGPNGFKAYQVGGLAPDMDLGPEMRHKLRTLLARCRDFMQRVFLPDLEHVARAYAHWAELGAVSCFLSHGDYLRSWQEGSFFPGGLISLDQDSGEWIARPGLDPIREEREPQWKQADQDRYRLRLGPDGPEFLWTREELAWIPAPRLGEKEYGLACEVGTLARVLAAWAHGRERLGRIMRASLANCGLNAAAMNSTLGRLLARGMEARVLTQIAMHWLEELEACLAEGPDQLRTDLRLPASGLGTGVVEVPRGTLTHPIRLEQGRIVNHDYLIPSLWNFSPRDGRGTRGPLEQALLGIPVADPGNPVEILRTVHALDPCNACHVVIQDTRTGQTTTVAAK